ncbi:MAG: GNAT family N-acetyltransferase [Deltaproteobacteria bacterium HGW-Deltaproteobacteria-12]|jgi:acyl-CoA hydrolase/GNAT superfamily N-acetyltransferase|nr:MAG: GNAT family N-acetyltransferase [Deltaproteobacteria bacterium HGW-Deltaproteobacteria-12]
MKTPAPDWKQKIVEPPVALSGIKPGMRIFLGTGVSEPRTLVKHLLSSQMANLSDLELIQIISLGDVITLSTSQNKRKFRLKTFFSGWLASEAITAGIVDMIPCPFSSIPMLVASGAINIDAAFIQISPPDDAGFSSLGVSVDIAKQAMAKASLTIGEINEAVPRTMGDTFVHVNDFQYLIRAEEPLIYFNRWPVDDIADKMAANIASMVEDGSCLSFFLGPLYEALGKYLMHKNNLGIHTYTFTDVLMDLIKCGAVTNKKKKSFPGKSLTAYAQGTPELMQWLHNNPRIEFQGIDLIADHLKTGLIDKLVAILPARKIDLTGNIALHVGKRNITAGPGQIQELFTGAERSRGGKAIFALPSRNLKNESNILLSVDNFPNQFTTRESLDFIVTEYGIASFFGKSVRERAQALIDIAHPDDRANLVLAAKNARIIYADQIYLQDSGHFYPEKIAKTHQYSDGVKVFFRAIKPSDEEAMRRLFYRFSDDTVFYRYFSPIKTMPHSKMQEYVNVDYRRDMSIVGIVEEAGREEIIAEGRYSRRQENSRADTAFVVDEKFTGRGIASILLEMLIGHAREKGITGFSADILSDNKPMLKVYQKLPFAIKSKLKYGVYNLTIDFSEEEPSPVNFV